MICSRIFFLVGAGPKPNSWLLGVSCRSHSGSRMIFYPKFVNINFQRTDPEIRFSKKLGLPKKEADEEGSLKLLEKQQAPKTPVFPGQLPIVTRTYTGL